MTEVFSAERIDPSKLTVNNNEKSSAKGSTRYTKRYLQASMKRTLITIWLILLRRIQEYFCTATNRRS
jgi:hypothetical protein